MPSLETLFRDLTLMKIPSEILPPLFELLSGNKGFESFSSVLQISKKMIQFPTKVRVISNSRGCE